MIDKGIEHEMIYPQEIFNVIQSIFWGARISFKIKQNHQVRNVWGDMFDKLVSSKHKKAILWTHSNVFLTGVSINL